MTVSSTRQTLAGHIASRLEADGDQLAAGWAASGTIRHFCVDGLLPDDDARAVAAAFPGEDRLELHKSIRELKYIGVQMDRFDPLIEEVTYAFQDPRVVAAVGRITGIPELLPDAQLYAGGVSSMEPGHYLHPHLDNSHDAERDRWRVLNLLYYVTPDRHADQGGNLELWPQGMGRGRVTIPSDFNRLVVMETHGGSLHSVSPVGAGPARRCVSNYYFSPRPLRDDDRFHVTSFRARPGDRGLDALLRADAALRMGLRRLRAEGVRRTSHIYKRGG
ncbi:2OG-Fe(II) oxygenase [Acidiferrimicrobium sp. IK]|uniref:2OG-Fe(II) oxygenase n=1 Tax=Acidiferrimicrobium sp. IK TaxID=2871700 RepID=UPI0021CAEA1E|nr:2OG-Fe(II) oxygenase [Acidiferrimicrobium sp. IK]MCU4185672.1 2OG-Fe(II) oxygenase [Acidiferrimicrobium sp. IK]